MQWIFMLVGLVLGALADETLTAALLGALLGLGLGQALKLQGLERENGALKDQLKAFSQRFDQGTTALHERLHTLEQAGVMPPQPAAQPRSDASLAEPPQVAAQRAQAVEPELELDWTLDFQLPEAPVAAASAASMAAPSEPQIAAKPATLRKPA
ncbi:MAG TPA: DUF2339 domain-containing protein, partial [Pseudomonas sp.]|nr:DUF2339 domain-containing protein [Pseudomonas sp.]